jgi:hypothetical protein
MHNYNNFYAQTDQSLAKKKSIGFQTAQPKKKKKKHRAQGFLAFDTK